MTPTNYSRGRSFEYRVRDALKKRGAVFVMRAAQSKGIADLLALWPLERWQVDEQRHVYEIVAPWLVQAKYSIHGGGYLPGKEALELKELAAVTGGLPVFARPGKNGRGVEFIDLSTKEQL